jgi:hypothetical protein
MESSRFIGLLTAVLLAACVERASAAETRPNAATIRANTAEARLALVIGNSAYSAAPLRNPVNDASDFADALRASGFEVTRLENANLREIRAALRDFGDKLKRQGGVGLFYFAGHGMQVKGRNYLIPVGAQIEREDEVEFESLDANLVLEKLDSAGNRFNIVILDACRNNPFARSFRSGTQGLAQMDAPSGTVVAFATSPGSVASDGGGRNGLYSQHLIESVHEPGLKIEEVFKRVRAAVRRDSAGRQTPWESTSLEGDFYFHPVDVAAAETARKQQEQERLEAAVRVAVAQERERARKEFDDARLQASTGLPAQTVASATKEPAPEVVVEPATVTAAIPSTTLPQLSSPSPSTAPDALITTPAAADRIFGAPVTGQIRAPDVEVDDEWEFLSVTTTSALTLSQPAPTYSRVRVETLLGVTGGSEAMLSSVPIDKPGGVATDPLDFYKTPAGTNDYFVRALNVDGRQKLRFPLGPGSRWSSSDPFRARNGASGRIDFEYRAAAWEKITVPAGTFWALKIEVGGWRYDLSTIVRGQQDPQRIEGTIWYSPEAKCAVKSTYRTGLLTATSTQLIRSRNTAGVSWDTKTVVN